MGSTTWKSLIVLIAHSNMIWIWLLLWRKKTFLNVAETGKRLFSPFYGGNRHVEHNLTTRHAQEVHILFLSEFGPVDSYKSFEKIPNSGFNCLLAHLDGADPDGEQNQTSNLWPDASYIIWFESAECTSGGENFVWGYSEKNILKIS